MQLGDFADESEWHCASDQFIFRQSGRHKHWFRQHAELVDERSHERCHHAGNILFHSFEWFNERESNGDHHLHAYGNQCQWLSHRHANCYGKHGKQANHQFLHRQSRKHYVGFQQHAELVGERSHEHCHHAGDIYVQLFDWFDERESNGDDHLYANGNQCVGLGHIHAGGYGNHSKRTREQLWDRKWEVVHLHHRIGRERRNIAEHSLRHVRARTGCYVGMRHADR